MAPPSESSTSFTETKETKELKFVLSAITFASLLAKFEPTWNDVAKENGMAYGRNASAKFRTIVKKQGYEFVGGKLMRLEVEDEEDEAEAAPQTPKKAVKRMATKTILKKRKAVEGSADEGDEHVKVKKEDHE